MQRQAATSRGFERRAHDLGFGCIPEHRQASKVKLRLSTLLTALLAATVNKARSLRMVEQRTAQMAAKQRGALGIDRRIADNTFGKVLCQLRFVTLVACLHRLIKAELRRGNLEPTRLLLSTVAIDGKAVATLRWHDLCRVLELDSGEATPAQVRALLAERYPQAQLCEPELGLPYALLRMHTVTLISSAAAPCVHLRPIAGATNEIGSMPALLDELKAAYGRTGLITRLTTDAGNTSCGVMGRIVSHGWHYFGQIKRDHGAIHDEARRQLAHRRCQRAAASYSDSQNGKTVTYYVWRYDLTEQGWLQWTHARQLIRVERVVCDPHTGQTIVGNRFYASSQDPTGLTPRSALKLSRAHWRCEDETHWTADVELQEDRRRLAWSRHPTGILAVCALRMMALCILALARQLSRTGYSLERPSWAQVAEHFLLQLCGSVLDMQAFDVV